MKNLVKHICILICLVAISGNAWGTTGTLTLGSSNKFGTSSGSTKNDNQGNTWTCTCSGIQNSYNTTYVGQQFGTGSTPASATFTCTIANATISSVTATMSAGGTATYSISVGGVQKYTGSLTTTSTSYGGTNATGTGTISIAITPSSKAVYLGSITVVYTTATTYTVTYNLNGGTGTTPTETSKTKDATFTLHNGTSSITAPTGKSFSQWKDQDDNLYNGGATYTMPAKNVTLTAQWSCITPSISADPSSATYWDMDSPTALTVTASGGSLSYQWQKSADGSSSWSNVGTNSSSYTPLVANGTQYYRCIVTNTGSSCSTTATSENALITIKTLSSIAVKTSPKTTYFAGETFDPTGLVITLTASDATTQDRSYATYSSGFTFSPTTATALTTSDDAVTITYGGQSDNLSISVYSVTVNKVDDAGNSVSADGVTATWTVGTKALAAGYGSTQYRFKEWAFDGSNNGLSITSTGSANTTITGTPTGNVTIKAIFYAPRTIKWSVSGDDSYDTGSPTKSVPYGTQWKNLTLPTDPAPGSCSGSDKFMGWIASELDHDLDKTDDASDITTLEGEILNSSTKSGRTTEITDATTTFYAVFADYAE